MSRRAFTLLELVVGVAMSIIVVGTVTAILANVLIDNRRQSIHGELRRDAELLNQTIARELRQAGSGVPTGAHITAAYGTTPPATFQVRRILVADAEAILFLGDFPRYEVTYPVFGPLSTQFTGGGRNRVCWHTENNGSCCRGITNTCDASNSSIFFAGTVATDDCADGSFRRTCPWYDRLNDTNDRIVIADGSGAWTHAGVGPDLNAEVDAPPIPGVVSLKLSTRWNTVWPSTTTDEPPTGTLGQGFVTQLDRVGYFYDAANRRIRRLQCSGDPDPNHANWPGPTATAIPASLVVTPDGVSTTCVPTETIARNVASVAFSYFDAANAAITDPNTATNKNLIRRVEWAIVLEAPSNIAGQAPIRYDVAGTVALQNIQQGEP